MALGIAERRARAAGIGTSIRARLFSLSTPSTLALVALLVFATVARVHDLGARSLWVDELFSVGLAVQDLSTILFVLYGEEANMALYYFVMSIWVRLVGGDASEFWLRLPSVAFGVASIWALYALGSEIDRPFAGLAAAAVASVNAYHVAISQEARAYSLWALLVALSWLWLIRAVGRGQRRLWLSYALCVALAFYAHIFTIFLVLAQVAYVALHSHRSLVASHVASGLVVAVLCLPWVPFFIENHNAGQILHVREADAADLLDLFRLFGGADRLVWLGYLTLGVLAVAAAIVGWRRSRDRAALLRRVAPLLWLVVPVLAIFFASYVNPMFKDRYIFAAMPAFPLLAGLGVAAIRPPVVAIGVLASVAALSLGPLLGDFRVRQDENWRAAVAYLETNAQPDDGWIFISKRGQLGYEYYAGWLGRPAQPRPRPAVLEDFSWHDLATAETNYRGLASGTRRLPQFTAQHSRIWLVLSHEFDATFGGDTSASIRDWLTRNGYAARQRTFQGIRVLLYQRLT